MILTRRRLITSAASAALLAGIPSRLIAQLSGDPPKIAVDSATGLDIYYAQTNSKLITAEFNSAGGSGCATDDDVNGNYPYTLYGKVGGDAAFLLKSTVNVTVDSVSVGFWPNPVARVNLANHGLTPGMFFLFGTPPSGWVNTFYYVMVDGYTANSFLVSLVPYSPPFCFACLGYNAAYPFQTPVEYGGGTQNVTAFWPYYWNGGGGGGGKVGDNGSGKGSYGWWLNGPDGRVQAYHRTSGNGSVGKGIGGDGGVTMGGGNPSSQVQNAGNAAGDGSGAGGGGAPPNVNNDTWGGSGGASGSYTKAWVSSSSNAPFWWYLGAPGAAVAAGTNGYPSGRGGYGKMLLLDWK